MRLMKFLRSDDDCGDGPERAIMQCSVETLERVSRRILNVLADVNPRFLRFDVECHGNWVEKVLEKLISQRVEY